MIDSNKLSKVQYLIDAYRNAYDNYASKLNKVDDPYEIINDFKNKYYPIKDNLKKIKDNLDLKDSTDRIIKKRIDDLFYDHYNFTEFSAVKENLNEDSFLKDHIPTKEDLNIIITRAFEKGLIDILVEIGMRYNKSEDDVIDQVWEMIKKPYIVDLKNKLVQAAERAFNEEFSFNECINESFGVFCDYEDEPLEVFASEDEAKSYAAELRDLYDSGAYRAPSGNFWVEDMYNESLNEDLNQEEIGISSLFNDLIKQEYDLLNQYDSAQVTLEDMGEDRFSDIFDYIRDDVNIHIGMLQASLEDVSDTTDQVKDGKEQAEEILSDNTSSDESVFDQEKMTEYYDPTGVRNPREYYYTVDSDQGELDFNTLQDAIEKANELGIDTITFGPEMSTKIIYKYIKGSNGEFEKYIQMRDGSWRKKQIESENKLTLDESLFDEAFDERTELIKKIDKYLYNNPNEQPPEGYVDSKSRSYEDLSKKYGDYVTTKFYYVKTDDLRDYANNHNLLESLSNDEDKELILDAIDTFIDLGSYPFDPDMFGCDSWEELRDQVEMGIDYIPTEIASIIIDYLKPSIDFNNKHPELVEDDPQADIEQDIYDDMHKILNKYN